MVSGKGCRWDGSGRRSACPLPCVDRNQAIFYLLNGLGVSCGAPSPAIGRGPRSPLRDLLVGGPAQA